MEITRNIIRRIWFWSIRKNLFPYLTTNVFFRKSETCFDSLAMINNSPIDGITRIVNDGRGGRIFETDEEMEAEIIKNLQPNPNMGQYQTITNFIKNH